MDLVEHFDDDVRARGRNYVSRIDFQRRAPDGATATVRGTRLYQLGIERDGRYAEAWCTCPYFASTGPCKHLYAFLTRLMDEDRQLWRDPKLDISFDQVPDVDIAPEPPPRPRATSWRKVVEPLMAVRGRPPSQATYGGAVVYVLDVAASLAQGALVVETAQRPLKLDGTLGKPKRVELSAADVGALGDAADRELVAQLTGVRAAESYSYYGGGYDSSRGFTLAEPLAARLIAAMCATGRCHLRRADGTLSPPLQWHADEVWQVWLETTPADGDSYRITPCLRGGDGERLAIEQVHLIAGGVVVAEPRAAEFSGGHASRWADLGRAQPMPPVPKEEALDFVQAVLDAERPPRLALPPELELEEARSKPMPRLRLASRRNQYAALEMLDAKLSFDYDGFIVDGDHETRGALVDRPRRRLIVRDAAAESAAEAALASAGVRSRREYSGALIREIGARHLTRLVRTLAAAGWHVEVEGRRLRVAGTRELSVSSGIDWFDLEGAVHFGELRAELPELLRALRRGDDTIVLADGSHGILPVEWLSQLGLAADLANGKRELRFARGQAALLDALLATQPDVVADAGFARARAELARFEGIAPADPPRGFTGELRGYQREGLGWLQFLQRLGVGGCLADDMGLGKTVQVLALLAGRSKHGPSLVVVPRSLVFNWVEEARRFTPRLRVLVHAGAGRGSGPDAFAGHDVVLTTYGTLRRDAALFSGLEFDYVILDEAQAIKNASSASAKAARLLRGAYRLALSGTPMENHIGELGSIFAFLNPGLLGRLELKVEHAELLGRALRPYLLRRTKEQVARELPAKLEETIYCELDAGERRRYEELRQHYRASLLRDVERQGLGRTKIKVLEALLRLRQAACHPGLVDRTRSADGSAKLDALLPQLAEVVEGGHKALVFSQFTSLLAIVRARLDERGMTYEYLDGKTRDRQRRVERFQNDPGCRLFLVSLKAGGLGLNLTAAEYVFLLDPWWNPAVEAQAIDRAHRIGQTRPVFAYRLIARDTVEEKVIELQRQKRALADAIVRADESLVRTLRREDLELLLS